MQAQPVMVDRIKLVISVLLLVAGLAAFHIFGDQSGWLRFAMVLAGIAAAVGASWTSGPGRNLRAFARESIVESRKVAWPSRKESLQTTAAVFGFVVIMAIFLWVVDKLLEWGIYDLVLGWKR
jgi:preprotein translocase subunit SecE